MSEISLIDVDALVENKDLSLDETLDIVPQSSQPVFFDDKNIELYPQDKQLEKIIDDSNAVEVPMADGEGSLFVTRAALKDPEFQKALDKANGMPTYHKIAYGVAAYLLIRSIIK